MHAAFFGPLTRGFGRIDGDDLEDILCFLQDLLAGQSELPTGHQGRFDAFHRALHGGFVDAPIVAQVSKRAVFAPELQRQEELLSES